MTIDEFVKSTSEMPLEKKVVLNVLVSANVLSERMAEVLKPFDLTGEQYNVLRILRGQKGKPANMCAIQERMLARTSNTTRLVDKLLVKGLVTREVCSENRRKMEVRITPAGIELLKKLDPLVDSYEAAFCQNLDRDQLMQLNELLEKYRTI